MLENEQFVRGMIDGAQWQLQGLRWYDFLQRAEIKGFILACKMMLGEDQCGK